MKSDTPDSLYSWVVAIECHIMYFLIFGMTRISGGLFAESVTFYNIDRQVASLPFAMSSSVGSIIGPVVGCLVDAYGFRPVILMGSVLSVLGVGGCFFADNIVTICVFRGLLFGIGDALTLRALPHMIYLFFERHVSTATGLALIGAPIGGFVLSPITDVLLKKYGLNGTYLILGGIVLHTLPISMLFKEPKSKSPRLTISCSRRKSNKGEEANDAVKNLHSNSPNDDTTPYSKILSQSDPHLNEYTLGAEDKKQRRSSIARIPNNSVLAENDVEVALSVSNVSEKRPIRWFYAFSIFWHPIFLLIALPACLHKLSFIVVPTLMVDYSKDKGLSGSMSAYILMSLYSADLFGKVSFGWVTDRGYLSVARFASLCFFLTAVSYACTTWPTTFSTMVTAAVFLGMCLGTISSITPRLISEYIEADKRTVAMTSGDILLFPIGFLVPSLVGYFRDDLGSYDWLMYLMSIVLIMSSILLFFLPQLVNWRRTKKKTFCIKS